MTTPLSFTRSHANDCALSGIENGVTKVVSGACNDDHLAAHLSCVSNCSHLENASVVVSDFGNASRCRPGTKDCSEGFGACSDHTH